MTVKVKIENSKCKFARVIGRKRRDLGLTLQQIQDKCGINRGYLWMIENEKRGIPTIETIMKIEKGMGVKCGELVNEAVKSLKKDVYGK